MGCFSFMCEECGKPVLSNSFRGQSVKLYLLKDSKVIESMEGEYNSYGAVFTEDHNDSIDWATPWDNVCDLMFDSDKSNGIAAVHSKCFCGVIPTFRSDDDPNQGWGEDGELFGNYDKDLQL